MNLGGAINTSVDEATPDPFEDDATGARVLYYGFGPIGSGAVDDLWVTTRSKLKGST